MSAELLYIEYEDRAVIHLTVPRVLQLYTDLFGCTPEQAADQVRNMPGLEGALHRSQSYAYYNDADIEMQAAVLAHGLSEGQLFVDGNKRVALAALALFLRANGIWLTVTQDQLFMWIMGLSEGLTPEQLAQNIRENSASFWGRED